MTNIGPHAIGSACDGHLKEVVMQLPFEIPASIAGPLSDNRIQALLILVASVGVARLTDRLLCGFVGRVARRTATDLDDRIIQYLHRPIFYSVLLIGTRLSVHALVGRENVPIGGERLLFSVIILIWSSSSIRVFGVMLTWLANRPRAVIVHPRTLPLFVNMMKIVIVGTALYLVLVVWEINVSAWLASAGIVGIAVGFAAKDSLANLFAGIFIVTDAPYKVGDYIVFDTGERGRVNQIGLRSTRLITRDDVEITIPNSIIANAKIVNESGGPWERSRVRVQVGVAYGSDIDRVREVLMDIARQATVLCDNPEPRVRLRGFGDSGLNFELLGWIEMPELKGRVLDELNCEVYKQFAAHGIEIPFPKRDLFIKEMPLSAAGS
jgi:small-conductance mechanosensitive channel